MKIFRKLKILLYIFLGFLGIVISIPILIFIIIYIMQFPYSDRFKSYDIAFEEHPVVLETVKYVEWIDNRHLVVANKNEFIVFDTDKKKIAVNYKNPPGSYRYLDTACLTPYGAILNLFKESDDIKQSKGQYYYFPDLLQPDNKQLVELSLNEGVYITPANTNLMDCKRLPFFKKDKANRTLEDGQDYRYTYTYDLFLYKHGDLIRYIENTGKELVRREKKFFLVREEYPDILLKFDHAQDNYNKEYDLYSDYDHKKNQYLLYDVQREFKRDPDSLKAQAWIISPNLDLIKDITLPVGPWIVPDRRAFCSSGGCDSQDRAHMKLKNGKIFINIFGPGVKWKHKGIYLLNEETQQWDPLVIGRIGLDFAVTDDGCKVAYSGDSPGYIDICKTG